MTKNALIKRLQKIPGNPQVLVSTRDRVVNVVPLYRNDVVWVITDADERRWARIEGTRPPKRSRRAK